MFAPPNGENVSSHQRGAAQGGGQDERFLFTSESVGVGHPDKLCDIISDAILDAYLAQDAESKVSCSVAAKTGMIMVLGTVNSSANVDCEKIVRETVRRIGYDESGKGFDGTTCNVLMAMTKELGKPTKNDNEEISVSDQGLVFGYATDETVECMPLTLLLAHRLTAKYQTLRENGTFSWGRPDAKSQVTIEYKFSNGSCVPVRIHSIVMSVQHSPDISLESLRKELLNKVILTTCPSNYMDSKTQFHLNPCGTFLQGGPMGDAGLTGRKIIVDTYGGWGAHGGGAFSGKDPSKVDRSAAYAARWIAKSLVAAGLCRRVLIQIAYGYGSSEPVSLTIFSYGTSPLSEDELLKVVKWNFDLRPSSIVRELDLHQPIYTKTSENGHFGHEEFKWEMVKKIKVPFDYAQTVVKP